MFELLYQGYDTLDIAFQGALRPEVVDQLKAARSEAEEQDQDQLITFGPGQVEAHIGPRGMKGGYRFVLNTGYEGAQWKFKVGLGRGDWNGFVSVSAAMLATRSIDDVEQEIWGTLEGMGFHITGHSVNRFDYAFDFATDHFEPNEKQFVAHSASKVRPHRGDKEIDDTKPSSVIRGRRTESVTVGMMPGRQIIVYDKRRQAIVKRKLWWFDVWKINRDEDTREIWRVEIRAGKNELKEKWRLRTLDEIKASIGDILLTALSDIRYVNDHQQDTNVSRQTLHPLWQAVTEAVENSDKLERTGLQRGAIRVVERIKAQTIAKTQITGNAIGLAAANGWTVEEAIEFLADTLKDEMLGFQNSDPDRFQRKLSKAKEKVHFLDSQ